jgi:uncharacterized iron-regulated protein
MAAYPARSVSQTQWQSQHFRDHPLAGTIWNAALQPVAGEELEQRLARARFVLLGEIHNNPDHHRLQAQLIGALVKRGRRPSIVLEMVPADLQAELDRHRGDGLSGAIGLGKLLQWEERGWPAWPIYQPIAEVALSAGLTLLAGGLDSRAEKAIRSGQPLPRGTPLETGALQPLEPPLSQALSREVQEAHCNLLPPSAVEPMVRIQRLRDAYLARAMFLASERDGAVLIAGVGHVRKDWAVPRILNGNMLNGSAVVLAFVEVDPAQTKPAEYLPTVPGAESPFDYLYFTPRADVTDHCAALDKKFKKKPRTPVEQ